MSFETKAVLMIGNAQTSLVAPSNRILLLITNAAG
jgi:hypothetical protein